MSYDFDSEFNKFVESEAEAGRAVPAAVKTAMRANRAWWRAAAMIVADVHAANGRAPGEVQWAEVVDVVDRFPVEEDNELLAWPVPQDNAG